MDSKNLKNSFICIQYPGQVKNVDNMIKTLGGISQISETFNVEHRRLQLKFRPDSVFAKYAYGDRSQATGVLLKVKVRKRKSDAKTAEYSSQSVSILGLVRYVYKFESICDFQYLPIVEDSSTKKPVCIYDDLVPKGMISPEWLMSGEGIPYFLPPLSFSRFDTVQPNLFRKEQTKVDVDNTAEDDGLIGKTRLRRIKHASYISFNLTDPIPDPPLTTAVATEYLKVKFITLEQFKTVKELFDKRPIMSKMVVSYETKIPNDKLKYILPILCYYYTTGPWRIMWVRYGYDPRKDFESRYYQQLDYRVRTHTGIKDHIDLKSSTSTQKTTKKGSLKVQANNTSDRHKKVDIIYYPYFESGRLPQSRQCIYQYCDIRVPKIQEMLDKIPTPLSGATCSEKSGWLPVHFDDQCREILSDIIRELISKNKEEDNEYVDEEEMYSEDDEQLDDNIEDSENEPDDTMLSQ